jgi:hypothetical protein
MAGVEVAPTSRLPYYRGMHERDVVDELNRWFLSQCDDDWEHSHHIELGTTDNPGWAIVIELQGTELESRPFEPLEVKRSATDYVACRRYPDAWQADCGVHNLKEAVAHFLDWARPAERRSDAR